MNILHICKHYFHEMGGMETYIRTLVQGQLAAGHDVTVLAAGDNMKPAVQTSNGLTVRQLSRWGTFASTPLTPGLPLALTRYRPDITHVHSPYPPAELFNTLLGRSRFTVIGYHSDIIRQRHLFKLYEPFLKMTLKKANVIICSSSNYIETSPLLSIFRDKCRVVPYGIDIERFASPELSVLENLGRKFGRFTILFVGKLRYYKGLNHLIEAMLRVKDADLIIVGDGPLRSELESQVAALKLTECIHFVGRVEDEDLPAHYHAADCFVLPSDSRAEAFGIVLLEAMAAGLPLVTTELGTGTSFVNIHGKTGFVVPPGDADALSEAINTLRKDVALRERFAQGGREQVRTEFSQEGMVDRMMNIYDQLLTKGSLEKISPVWQGAAQ
ncbi:MAG: hypothetical protein A3G87_06080 [Omnitrophica bacterium RIFCSPLOWO2_12_FULL_50_11]|nr:MAG: hypothetical protein A3G87_06080 [Omnitrophica bacterium RIFCSPLOWO2_12_FULL_50_11]